MYEQEIVGRMEYFNERKAEVEAQCTAAECSIVSLAGFCGLCCRTPNRMSCDCAYCLVCMCCTSVAVCVWNENICNLMKECNEAWERGNGRGNAFRFTSGGCPCCWYKTVVIFSRERRYCTVLLLKKKKNSYKSEQMLLVSSHGHCCSVWSLWQAPFCLALLCVKVVKMTGSVLSQTHSKDVKMECFSSCLLRFFIVISYCSVTFKSARTQTQWAIMSSRSFFTDLCQCCGLRCLRTQPTAERSRNWGGVWPQAPFNPQGRL